MKNPARRNRNIGTAKQGHGQANRLVIPQPCGSVFKAFYERLTNYVKHKSVINGHEFLFIIEQTRTYSRHACSVADIETIIQQIPKEDYGDLKFIVLRQPKRKEEILSLTWGRLLYAYEFENEFSPAIILDAVDLTKKIKWSNKLSIDDQKEIERLIEDGHKFKNNGRHYVADYELEPSRNTQLYRTLPHEFGHYVQYLDCVERLGTEDEDYETWEVRRDKYFELPKVEKERFAHKYADNLKSKLIGKHIIPFEPK